MINANDNSGLVSELVAAIARAYEWANFPSNKQKEYVVLPESKLREYAAKYVREDGENVRVFVWQGRLWLTPRLGTRLELLAEDEHGRFFIAGMEGWLRFERDQEGTVTQTRFSVFGSEGIARRE